ncbi:acyl carrier protein [Nocardia brasiliensis]|uniref:acyl carrier protein n=1 Tax=Nocardia brasiliensis TaxID=37326 RepID=UPI003672762E
MTTEGIIEILTDMGVATDDIDDSSSMRETLGLDSTEMVELRLEIKEKYGVVLDFAAQPDFTVGELAALVSSGHTVRAE